MLQKHSAYFDSLIFSPSSPLVHSQAINIWTLYVYSLIFIESFIFTPVFFDKWRHIAENPFNFYPIFAVAIEYTLRSAPGPLFGNLERTHNPMDTRRVVTDSGAVTSFPSSGRRRSMTGDRKEPWSCFHRDPKRTAETRKKTVSARGRCTIYRCTLEMPSTRHGTRRRNFDADRPSARPGPPRPARETRLLPESRLSNVTTGHGPSHTIALPSSRACQGFLCSPTVLVSFTQRVST